MGLQLEGTAHHDGQVWRQKCDTVAHNVYMSLCACMCVCACIHVSVRASVYLSLCMFACIYVSLSVFICMSPCAPPPPPPRLLQSLYLFLSFSPCASACVSESVWYVAYALCISILGVESDRAISLDGVTQGPQATLTVLSKQGGERRSFPRRPCSAGDALLPSILPSSWKSKAVVAHYTIFNLSYLIFF